MLFSDRRVSKFIAAVLIIVCGGGAAICQEPAAEPVSPGFSTVFSVPPYAMDETIIGVDGWQTPRGEASKEMPGAVNCRVVEDPWGDQPAVLKLQREEPELIHLTNIFREKIEGVIEIKAGMAFDLPTRRHGSATNVIIPGVGAELSFGIDYAEGGGLFYAYQPPESEKPRKVIMLGIDELVEHKLYEFKFTMNLDECLFSVELKGERMDGEALEYVLSEVEYQRRPRNLGLSLGAIGLWSSAAAQISVYLSSLSVQEAP